MHALFRCAHTIQGSGGLFRLDLKMVVSPMWWKTCLTACTREIPFSSELITVLLEGPGQISALVNASLGEGIADQALQRGKRPFRPD